MKTILGGLIEIAQQADRNAEHHFDHQRQKYTDKSKAYSRLAEDIRELIEKHRDTIGY